MRIRELEGWPPRTYMSSDGQGPTFSPRDPDRLRIRSVAFIHGYRRLQSSGALIVVLADPEGKYCSLRIRVEDPEVGRRLEEILAMCKGCTVSEAGDREIPAAMRRLAKLV